MGLTCLSSWVANVVNCDKPLELAQLHVGVREVEFVEEPCIQSGCVDNEVEQLPPVATITLCSLLSIAV